MLSQKLLHKFLLLSKKLYVYYGSGSIKRCDYLIHIYLQKYVTEPDVLTEACRELKIKLRFCDVPFSWVWQNMYFYCPNGLDYEIKQAGFFTYVFDVTSQVHVDYLLSKNIDRSFICYNRIRTKIRGYDMIPYKGTFTEIMDVLRDSVKLYENGIISSGSFLANLIVYNDKLTPVEMYKIISRHVKKIKTKKGIINMFVIV